MAGMTKNGRPRKKPGPAKKAQRVQQQLIIAERRKKALELKAAGWPIAAIVKHLDYADDKHCHHDIAQALKDIPRQAAQTMLGIQLQQLDRLKAYTLSKLDLGGPTTPGGPNRALSMDDHKNNVMLLKAGLRVLDQEANLLGLYAARKLEHSGFIDGVDVSTLDEGQLQALRAGKPLPPAAITVREITSPHVPVSDASGADIPGSHPLDEPNGSSGVGNPSPQSPPH